MMAQADRQPAPDRGPLTNLKRLRDAAGLTQAGLSYLSKVAESRISLLENARLREDVESVTVTTLRKLATTLKVKPSTIYPGVTQR